MDKSAYGFLFSSKLCMANSSAFGGFSKFTSNGNKGFYEVESVNRDSFGKQPVVSEVTMKSKSIVGKTDICLGTSLDNINDNNYRSRPYEATPTDSTFVQSLSFFLTQIATANSSNSSYDIGMLTPFHAVCVPSIPIRAYLMRIAHHFGCSNECFVLALIYIGRIIKVNRNFTLSLLNVHRVIVTALMLATKFFDDVYYSNAFYARVSGVGTKELNSLEIHFLRLVRFQLFVTIQEYEACRCCVMRAAEAVATASILPSMIMQPCDMNNLNSTFGISSNITNNTLFNEYTCSCSSNSCYCGFGTNRIGFNTNINGHVTNPAASLSNSQVITPESTAPSSNNSFIAPDPYFPCCTKFNSVHDKNQHGYTEPVQLSSICHSVSNGCYGGSDQTRVNYGNTYQINQVHIQRNFSNFNTSLNFAGGSVHISSNNNKSLVNQHSQHSWQNASQPYSAPQSTININTNSNNNFNINGCKQISNSVNLANFKETHHSICGVNNQSRPNISSQITCQDTVAMNDSSIHPNRNRIYNISDGQISSAISSIVNTGAPIPPEDLTSSLTQDMTIKTYNLYYSTLLDNRLIA
ncbi:N-terminal domain-containing protein [Cryptosporidium andersoni]|uniref:N-terminal domain-containing protein n=1 Tax=Cryptosporidium andersoni TaxID=117008 RepID=A0A1J4MEJ1_9CRYT|nr:N-terminal domain-containing protein [Cryptosporidium andersoni]